VEAAEAAAAKARAEADKASAEARSAVARARTDEITVTEHDSAAARRQRDAQAAKATAAANKEAAEARRAQISTLVPDLSTVKESSLTVTGEPALRGTVLAHRALDAATSTLAAATPEAWREPAGPVRVLVTSDSKLADSDSIYRDVTTGLRQLTALATDVLAATGAEETVAGLDVLGALAAAVPSALSLFSAQRTVTTRTVTVSDEAAAASAAGAILAACPQAGENLTVVHDDFRLLPRTGVYTSSDELSKQRGKLLVRKVELAVGKSKADRELAEAKTLVADLQRQLKDAAGDAKKDLEDRLSRAEGQLPRLDAAASQAAAGVLVSETILATIDTFTTALTTVATGSRRSPLATAALRELLHPPETETDPGSSTGGTPAGQVPYFSHVLLVRAEAGSSEQVVSNRPLWWRDRFSTVATVGVTYMLIRTPDSAIVAAGTALGTATARGTIGDAIRVT